MPVIVYRVKKRTKESIKPIMDTQKDTRNENAPQYFYELDVYKSCRSFRIKVSQIVRNRFPKSEQFLLSSQLLDASRSVTANIAEGNGRFYYKENMHFCRIARGSLNESFEHLMCAHDESYVDATILKEMQLEYKDCLKLLNAYISYLKRQSGKPRKN